MVLMRVRTTTLVTRMENSIANEEDTGYDRAREQCHSRGRHAFYVALPTLVASKVQHRLAKVCHEVVRARHQRVMLRSIAARAQTRGCLALPLDRKGAPRRPHASLDICQGSPRLRQASTRPRHPSLDSRK